MSSAWFCGMSRIISLAPDGAAIAPSTALCGRHAEPLYDAKSRRAWTHTVKPAAMRPGMDLLGRDRRYSGENSVPVFTGDGADAVPRASSCDASSPVHTEVAGGPTSGLGGSLTA